MNGITTVFLYNRREKSMKRIKCWYKKSKRGSVTMAVILIIFGLGALGFGLHQDGYLDKYLKDLPFFSAAGVAGWYAQK
jgi:hypothetical protein